MSEAKITIKFDDIGGKSKDISEQTIYLIFAAVSICSRARKAADTTVWQILLLFIAVVLVFVLCCISSPTISIAGFLFSLSAMVLQVISRDGQCLSDWCVQLAAWSHWDEQTQSNGADYDWAFILAV